MTHSQIPTESVAVLGAGGTMGAAEHGDEDFCATYLTSAPDRAA
jgi:hypothetical protein